MRLFVAHRPIIHEHPVTSAERHTPLHRH